MTKFLASVQSLEEANIAVNTGVDILDLKNPSEGVLGALDLDTICSITQKYHNKITISATVGDVPLCCDQLQVAIDKILPSNVDIIKVGVFGRTITQDIIEMLSHYYLQNKKIVLVVFGDLLTESRHVIDNIDSSIVYGVMLDTVNKQNGSLLNYMSFEQLSEFIIHAKSKQLLTGFAGSLKSTDIEYLLPLKPDYLGFRGALCRDTERNQLIDELAIKLIREKITKPTTTLMQNI